MSEVPTKIQAEKWFRDNWPNFLDDCGEGLTPT